MATIEEVDSLNYDIVKQIFKPDVSYVAHNYTESYHRYKFLLDIKKRDKLIDDGNYVNRQYFRYLYMMPDNFIVKEYKKYVDNQDTKNGRLNITKIDAIRKLSDVRNLNIVELHKATKNQIDKLIDIVTNKKKYPNVMDFLDSQKWTKNYVLDLVKSSEIDSSEAIPYKKYFHWIITDNNVTVGYVGLHPALNQIDQDGLQIRIFVGEPRKGYASFGIAEAIFEYYNYSTVNNSNLGDGYRKIYSIVDINNAKSVEFLKSIFRMKLLPEKLTLGKINYNVYIYEL